MCIFEGAFVPDVVTIITIDMVAYMSGEGMAASYTFFTPVMGILDGCVCFQV